MKKNLSQKKRWRRITVRYIRNIVREEFKIHESNIKEPINSTVNKTNECLDKLSAEIVDLTASLEFTPKKNWRGTIPVKKINKKIIKNKGQRHRRWSVKWRWNIYKINWIRGQISKE